MTFSACSDDEWAAGEAVEGQGVYFPSTQETEYTVSEASGTITLDVYRTNGEEASQAEVTATFSEGAQEVFNIPNTVSFGSGENHTTLDIAYNNIEQGTTYSITLNFTEGTQYATSSLTLTVLYPSAPVYTWTVISENAILTESIFSIIGMENIQTTGITVEKANEGEIYRFRSPFNNAYFYDAFGGNIFDDDSNLPYIILDGETYKNNNGESMYYIAPTALGFSLSVEGNSVYIDPDDKETQSFGSVAGNLSTADGPIEPGNATYPLGSYDESKKMFDLGCVYLDVANYNIMTTVAGATTLALDPSLLEPDYDRDYTWNAVPEATGYFTSELTGESWMQAIEQAEEDSTFYRMPNLYSPAEKAHIYFHVNMETGEVNIPEGQNTGMTTFGNEVFLKGTSRASSYDAVTGTLTLGFTFYIADEEGETIADLQETVETFLWGQNEFDQLQQGTDIADYVGNWIVTFSNGSSNGEILASITQQNANTLALQGLSGGISGYDDTIYLTYDETTGWVRFDFQRAADYQGYYTYAASFNSETGSFSTEGLIGGLNKAGNLMFLNDESNEGKYDAMIYIATPDGEQFLTLSGYWNNLIWEPNAEGAEQTSLNAISMKSLKPVEKGIAPRRTYKTELNIQPKPRTNKAGTKNVTLDNSMKAAPKTTFSLTR